MLTEVTPRAIGGAAPIRPGPEGAYLDVAEDALTGFRLDAPIPGRIPVGATTTIAGTVTADDRDDFTIACLRFIRYGSANANDVFLCSSIIGNRFSVEAVFGADHRGLYTVEPFLFWPGSGSQAARARYGVVAVE